MTEPTQTSLENMIPLLLRHLSEGFLVRSAAWELADICHTTRDPRSFLQPRLISAHTMAECKGCLEQDRFWQPHSQTQTGMK